MFPAKFQAYIFNILGEKHHLCLAQFPETVKMLIKIWKLEENRSKTAEIDGNSSWSPCWIIFRCAETLELQNLAVLLSPLPWGLVLFICC